jgi:hypothetical protein
MKMSRKECISFLDRATIHYTTTIGDEIHCYCPFHDDNHISMSVNHKKGLWCCFAGCGSGTLEKLAERRGVTLTDEMTVIDDEPFVLSSMTIEDERIFIAGLEEPGDLVFDYLSRRLVCAKSTVMRLCAEYDIKQKMGSVVYPVCDLGGKRVGFVHQVITDKPGVGKGVNLGPVKTQLLGMLQLRGAEKVAYSISPLVVVEGSIDMLKVEIAGYGVVALMGCRASKEQVNLLLGMSDDIVIFLDADLPGRSGAIQLAEKLIEGGTIPRIVDWGEDVTSDPGSLSLPAIGGHIKYSHSAWCMVGGIND